MLLRDVVEDITDFCIGTGCFLLAIIPAVAAFVGWALNFQNLWQYWPPADIIVTLSNCFQVLPLQWILSAVGVFIFPLGIITGYLW